MRQLVVKRGYQGPEVPPLIRAMNKRRVARGLPPIPVTDRMGDFEWRAWEETYVALGGLPGTFAGGTIRALRRYGFVRFPRTSRGVLALRRAKAWKRAHAGSKPKIVRLNAPMTQNQGALGSLLGLVGHYTYGPRDTSDAHALSLLRTYNAQHRSQGWGAIGYHLCIASSGTLILCRPTGWRGTHVAGGNTGRVGVVVLGAANQRMTAAQAKTWRWLKAHGNASAMPASHRLPKRPDRIWVHNDLNATSCPGSYESDYKGA